MNDVINEPREIIFHMLHELIQHHLEDYKICTLKILTLLSLPLKPPGLDASEWILLNIDNYLSHWPIERQVLEEY